MRDTDTTMTASTPHNPESSLRATGLSADSTDRADGTPRGLGALSIGLLLTTLCACGSSYPLSQGDGPGSVGRQELLAALPEMRDVPPGATLTTEYRSTGCEDLESGRRAPEVYREFRVPADQRARVTADLRRQLQAQGWAPEGGNHMSGHYPFVRTVPGGWRADLSLYTQAPDVLALSAQEADFVATCEAS